MLQIQLISDILKYLVNLSRDFENETDKPTVITALKYTDDGTNSELEVIAHGLWPRFFKTKRFICEVMKNSNINVHTYCIDKSIDMQIHSILQYDVINKKYIIETKNTLSKYSDYAQCVIITIETTVTSIRNLATNLSVIIQNMKKSHQEIVFKLVLPGIDKKSPEEKENDYKTISKSIANILTFSQNENFRRQCFNLLNVTNSGDAELRMQDKLGLLRKSSSSYSKQSKDSSLPDNNDFQKDFDPVFFKL